MIEPPPTPDEVLAIVRKAREVMGGAGHVTHTWRTFPVSHQDEVQRVAVEINLVYKEPKE